MWECTRERVQRNRNSHFPFQRMISSFLPVPLVTIAWVCFVVRRLFLGLQSLNSSSYYHGITLRGRRIYGREDDEYMVVRTMILSSHTCNRMEKRRWFCRRPVMENTMTGSVEECACGNNGPEKVLKEALEQSCQFSDYQPSLRCSPALLWSTWNLYLEPLPELCLTLIVSTGFTRSSPFSRFSKIYNIRSTR